MANLSHPSEPSKIPQNSSFNLALAVAGLRDIAERSCSGSIARRALRLAELLGEVVEPAVIALEHGIGDPLHRLNAAPVKPSNGPRPKVCPSQGDDAQIDGAGCQQTFDFDDCLSDRQGGTR
jgi:hypothetical protein